MAQMKAIWVEEFVEPEVLRYIDVERPEPGEGEALIFGRMVVFGAASRERGTIVPASLMRRCHAVVGFYLPQIMRRPDLFVPSLQEVLGWISTNGLKLTIGGTYPLAQAAEAHADLEGRKITGKILLNP